MENFVSIDQITSAEAAVEAMLATEVDGRDDILLKAGNTRDG